MSVPATELISVSNTPDFRLSTSMLDKVLLSASMVLFVKVIELLAVTSPEATKSIAPSPESS